VSGSTLNSSQTAILLLFKFTTRSSWPYFDPAVRGEIANLSRPDNQEEINL
jgi:hypothetical protein